MSWVNILQSVDKWFLIGLLLNGFVFFDLLKMKVGPVVRRKISLVFSSNTDGQFSTFEMLALMTVLHRLAYVLHKH